MAPPLAVAEGFWAQVGSAAATVVGAPPLWASMVARLDLRQVRPRRAEGTLARRLTSAAGVYFVLKQPRSAWSLEVELRPWVERF